MTDFILNNSELADLADKVAAKDRLTPAEARRIFDCPDLNAVGRLASIAAETKVGQRASYIVNRYINYSNYCILSCQFCSFARKKRDGDGFEHSIEEMAEKAREALKLGITELHIVGGLHPSLPFEYYPGMLRALKAVDVSLQLKCFTAVEIYHLERISKKPMPEVLAELKEAGLDSLTGGGAEIFEPTVRDTIARGRRRRRSIWRCTGNGIDSVGAARARCCLGTLKASTTASTTCGSCASCRMRRAVSRGSFRYRTNRRTTPCR